MIRVISSFADGPVNFHSTGPAEDQIQKLISSTGYEGLFLVFFVHCFVTCLLFQILCGKQLKRSEDETSFVSHLNKLVC